MKIFEEDITDFGKTSIGVNNAANNAFHLFIRYLFKNVYLYEIQARQILSLKQLQVQAQIFTVLSLRRM